MPACTVLLFCRNHFIDMHCHMFIAALEFVTQVKGIVLSILYAHACCEIRAAGTWLCTYGDQRSRDSSVDSDSFVLYLKPYVALRNDSINQSLGQDVSSSSGESGGSSGAHVSVHMEQLGSHATDFYEI